MYGLFESIDPDSHSRWQTLAVTAFKYYCKRLLINMHFVFLFRLFDQNYDGYIDKKEFKWMTTSAKISNKTIDIVFSVSFVT